MTSLIIVVLVFVAFIIYACSINALMTHFSNKSVPTNIISTLLVLFPIVNTLVAIYLGIPEYKNTLKLIFKR